MTRDLLSKKISTTRWWVAEAMRQGGNHEPVAFGSLVDPLGNEMWARLVSDSPINTLGREAIELARGWDTNFS